MHASPYPFAMIVALAASTLVMTPGFFAREYPGRYTRKHRVRGFCAQFFPDHLDRLSDARAMATAA
jgi:hypothetical protein